MAWLTGWSKRIKLTSDSTKVDADLTHFPITVFLKSGNGETTKVFDEVGSSYLKIAVADNSATPVQYYVEVEKWDSTNKVGVLHFGKSGEVLPSSANKDYYLYYDSAHADNTGYVGLIDSTPGAAVWDSNFKAVYHMVDATTSSIKDSTSNNYDGTKAAENKPIEADGKVGKGQNYTDTSCKISAANTLLGTAFSTSVLVKLTTLGFGLASTLQHGGRGHIVRMYGTGNVILVAYNYASGGYWANLSSGITPVTGTWYQVDTTWDGTTLKIFVDGVEKNSVSTNVVANTENFQIGSADVNCVNGIVDEVRVSTIARSAAWIKATYNSLNDSLLTYGSQETLAVGRSFGYIIG
ncbi:MAG: LamG domain-containing protein [Dehalococcoidia bacterium]